MAPRRQGSTVDHRVQPTRRCCAAICTARRAAGG